LIMKTKAVRLYGKNDIRLEEFELPPIKDNEILARVVSDSICMSSYKAVIQGSDHKRVPKDVDRNPIIIGHEFCGEIVAVGSKWRSSFNAGDKFTLQPALNMKHNPFIAPGYSYPYIGGDATYIIIPDEVMEMNCLLRYNGDAYFHGSLSEPVSCIVGGFHANYHTEKGSYTHKMDIAEGGNMAILAGAGPMGLGMIDCAIHREVKPSLLVVTDIDDSRLERASSIYTVEEAERNGIRLKYLNTGKSGDAFADLIRLAGGKGYDDVFVLAPVKEVVELGDRILGADGCLNFFAGPSNTAFSATVNFYNVHYNFTHAVGTSGGNTDDMIESLRMMEERKIDPASMITHIGGLDCVVDTTLNLPKIPGGKKLVYTNIKMALTAISDFREKGKADPMYAKLAEIVENNNGLWCVQAEKFLLENAEAI